MLQPPGSRGPRSAVVSNRRKTAESPDDQVRQLQRLAPNKRCADCTAKLPGCVNLTVGTFVCMTCAGILRECNQKIKGVGHSSFSTDDVEQLRATDNDAVNRLYLARYNPATERLRAPQDNHDQGHLRSWIRAKYVDKVWMDRGAAGAPVATPAQSSGGGRSAYGQQPTVAQIPPKQPELDLFGGDFGSSSAAASNDNQAWDAFGGSQQQQQQQQPAFQANFANFGETQGRAAPQQSNDAFPADFGSSQVRQQLQQPQQPAFQTNFANFDQQPGQQAQQGFANFNQLSPTAAPPQPPSHQQPAGNFANFNQSLHMPATLPQPNQQQAEGFATFPTQPSGFANFHPQLSPQAQPQPGGIPGPHQQQQILSNQMPETIQQPQGGFAPFNQSPQMPLQMAMPTQSQGNFANFDQPQQQPVKPTQNSVQQPAYIAETPQPSQLMGGFDQQHPAPQQLPHNQAQQQQGGFGSFPNPQMQPSTGVYGNMNQPQQQQPMSPQQQQQPQYQQQAVSPQIQQGGQAHDDLQVHANQGKTEAVDHFAALADLSLRKADSAITTEATTATKETPEPEKKPAPKGVSKYKSGQRVYYKSTSYVGMVDIVKVHLDDDLEPFYTISVDGKEKQTDDAHLAEKSPVQVEIESILLGLTEQQLKDVLNFVLRTQSGSASHGPPPSMLPSPQQQNSSHITPVPAQQPPIQALGNLTLQQPPLTPPRPLSAASGGSAGIQSPAVNADASLTIQPQAHAQPVQMQHPQPTPYGMAAQTSNTGAAFGGIPSPTAASPSHQMSNAFQSSSTPLPGPPLSNPPHVQMQQSPLQFQPSIMPNVPAQLAGGPHPIQSQAPAPPSQGAGNPFDIY